LVVTNYDPAAFDAYESAGWEAVAAAYEEHWSALTSQAVDPLLDAAWVGAGMRVLDIGTGTGDAAGGAAERGAVAMGVDVAVAMVDIATQRYPRASFVRASATELPFADATFDAAVGNIVIQHIGEPGSAAAELVRVLVSGGRVALSTWDAPESSPFFAALLGAVHDAEIPPPSEVPPGPSFFQFADDVAFRALLVEAGFADVRIGAATVALRLSSADHMLAALADGTVRTGALVRAADDVQRRRVRDSLEARLEEWRRGGAYVVPAAVKIASGRKPAKCESAWSSADEWPFRTTGETGRRAGNSPG
jgi:SAM-dependent methyltransferase